MSPAYVSAMCAVMLRGRAHHERREKRTALMAPVEGSGNASRHLVLVAMTLKNDLLDRCATNGSTWDTRRAPRFAMATFAERHQDLDLGALVTCTTFVTLLEARGRPQLLERAQIVRALLEESADPDNPPSAVADAHPGHRERLSTVYVRRRNRRRPRVRPWA